MAVPAVRREHAELYSIEKVYTASTKYRQLRGVYSTEGYIQLGGYTQLRGYIQLRPTLTARHIQLTGVYSTEEKQLLRLELLRPSFRTKVTHVR